MPEEITNPAEQTEPEETAPASSLSEFLGDTVSPEEAEELEQIVADGTISIATSAGGQFDVPVAEGEILTVQEVLIRSRLQTSGAVEFWVNGVKVDPTYTVGSGTRISVVGVVKGG